MAKQKKHHYVRVIGNELVGEDLRPLHGVKDGAIVRVIDRIGGIVFVSVPYNMLISPQYNGEQAIPYHLVEPYDEILQNGE